MGKTKRERGAKEPPDPAGLPVWPHTVQGGKLVESLRRHVAALRRESESHGNRALFLDDLFVVHLLAFFNPTVKSLRTIEDFSQTRQAQKHLSIPRICRSTHSDLNSVVDPDVLQPLLAELRKAVPARDLNGVIDRKYQEMLRDVVAVDGTFLPALAEVAWAVRCRNQRGFERHRARLDVHLDVHSGLPELVVVPDPGESEADSAARTIKPGAVHIYDRGFQSLALVHAHFGKPPKRGTNEEPAEPEPVAHFVQRLRQNGPNGVRFEPERERPIDPASAAWGVVSDRVGVLPGLDREFGVAPRLREVVVVREDGTEIRLLTSLLDLPAHLVAMLYKRRWTVELFFRWLKCYANVSHLVSTRKEGILFHFYVMVVATLLMYLHMVAKPSKYMVAMFGMLAQGSADLDEVLRILRERERQNLLARQSANRRAAAKRNA